MKRRTEVVLIIIATVIGVVLPIILSFYLARQEALSLEKERAYSYAQDALTRSEAVADQVDAGFKKLMAAQGNDPCSAKSQAIMKQIDLSSSYIQAIGVMADNRVLCSSLGTELDGFELGPADIVSPSGIKLRIDVQFPFTPENRFLVIERQGYVAVIHKDLPVDVRTGVPGIALATVALPELKVLASRGTIKPEWMMHLGNKKAVTFQDKDSLVAVVPSTRYFVTTICAIPVSELNKKIRSISLVLVPIGLLLSFVFAGMVYFFVKRNMAMPAMIKAALKHNELYLEYQPIIDIQNGRMVGAEALVRWRHMEDEIIRPDVFIPIAEECKLIRQISRRVVDLLAKEVPNLFERYPEFHIGINLSAADLHERETVFMLRELAAATGARRGSIMVEATESSFTDHCLARDVIDQLRAEGFPVAIDDFGTGYSSLSFLEHIELDLLKIDKSFVDTINTTAATSEVTLHIIEMARSLKLEMIAEGVETRVQAEFLRERGVQYAQGWLYGKPMSCDALLERLKHQSRIEDVA